ncbi:cytochrome P450 [Xylariomycetidae sp. FL2044]|nr:cytochrome P450 [Xylariomycetidae sp. FL2044]
MAPLSVIESIVVYASITLVTAVSLLFIYRLQLHPLRAFPGPTVAKLTDAYNGYFAFRKRLHLTSLQDHLTYGPVIRHGPNKLLFNTATALHAIYDNDRMVKSHINSAIMLAPGVYSLFTVIDKEAHRAKRRIVGSVINERAMRNFEPAMIEQVDILIRLLFTASSQSAEQPVNLTPLITSLACDIIALRSLGFPLRLQTDPTHRFMIAGMFRANHFTNTRMQWFRLHQLRVLRLVNYFTSGIRERYQWLLETMIKTRLAEDLDVREDLYSIMANAMSSGEDVRMSDIWTEAMSFFPAGAFSTSAATSALFFYLAHNRHCYDRLAAEIRATFALGAEIRGGPQLAACQYLRACIDEALRVAPPVPGTLWRELAAGEKTERPLVIDGHVIPPETQVGVNIFALHHNEAYFPEPYAFKPERWLVDDETSEEQRALMRDAFAPFSVGYRSCAGKPMAYLEAGLVVAKVLWYFDFRLASGPLGEIGGGTPGGRADLRGRRDEFQLYDVIGGEHDGPCLVLTPREGVCSDLQVLRDANGN